MKEILTNAFWGALIISVVTLIVALITFLLTLSKTFAIVFFVLLYGAVFIFGSYVIGTLVREHF